MIEDGDKNFIFKVFNILIGISLEKDVAIFQRNQYYSVIIIILALSTLIGWKFC